MRKFILFLIPVLIPFLCHAQQRVIYNKAQKEKIQYIPRPDLVSSPATWNSGQSATGAVKNLTDYDLVGTTYYDLQTQGALSNKITAWEDGSVACVFQIAYEQNTFPDRGTGYNYYDGNAWLPEPQARIENVRTGFPSHTDYLENGEMIVAHTAADTLIFNYRIEKGYGNWNSFIFQGPDPDWHRLLWAKLVTSGTDNNILQLLASTTPSSINGNPYNGLDPALLYSRSYDGGLSWNPKNIILPGMSSNEYLKIPIESYAWAEPMGNIIAFMVSDTWQSDMYIMKSNDNGDTWTKTIIWQHPYPFYDWNVDFTDTLWAPDGSHDIALGPDGKAHCVTGICRILYYVGSFQVEQWPFGEGIAYWNEDRPPFEDPNGNPHDALDAWNVLTEDYNLVGWSCDVNGDNQVTLLDDIFTYNNYIGLSTMPTLNIDGNNIVSLIYSVTTETYDNTINNFKHLWYRCFDETNWSEPEDLTDVMIYMFEECIFPCFAKKKTGSHRFFSYMTDANPGLAIYDEHPYHENKLYVNNFKPWGINENKIIETGFSISITAADGIIGNFIFFLETIEKTGISIGIYNTNGQLVKSIPEKNYTKGKHRLALNMQDLNRGVYLCSFSSGQQRIVRKIVY